MCPDRPAPKCCPQQDNSSATGERIVTEKNENARHKAGHNAKRRHCEERSDEAIHLAAQRRKMDCFASLGMTDKSPSFPRPYFFSMFQNTGVAGPSSTPDSLVLQPLRPCWGKEVREEGARDLGTYVVRSTAW